MQATPPWMRPRTLIEKDQATTNPEYGFDPNKRPLSMHLRFGVINLDKPPGPSSHEVVAWLKRILEVKHAGHGGTLEA